MIFIPVLVFSWRFSRGLRHWGLAVEREGELKPPKKPKMKPKFAAFAATRRFSLPPSRSICRITERGVRPFEFFSRLRILSPVGRKKKEEKK